MSIVGHGGKGCAARYRISSRYRGPNENFVLVVLASPFDSIARRAFWLLTPSTPISRRDIKAKPWLVSG
jgi:hypothetical protein